MACSALSPVVSRLCGGCYLLCSAAKCREGDILERKMKMGHVVKRLFFELGMEKNVGIW